MRALPWPHARVEAGTLAREVPRCGTEGQCVRKGAWR